VERTFTPGEANAALAEVRPLVEKMVAAKQALDRAQDRRDEATAHISGNGGGMTPHSLARLHAAVDRCLRTLAVAVDAIDALGVLVKDLDTGLVDFPALRDGAPVLLCWRLGEPEVAFWHTPDEGFGGRRPL
jgi:hypothetical protein